MSQFLSTCILSAFATAAWIGVLWFIWASIKYIYDETSNYWKRVKEAEEYGYQRGYRDGKLEKDTLK